MVRYQYCSRTTKETPDADAKWIDRYPAIQLADPAVYVWMREWPEGEEPGNPQLISYHEKE